MKLVQGAIGLEQLFLHGIARRALILQGAIGHAVGNTLELLDDQIERAVVTCLGAGNKMLQGGVATGGGATKLCSILLADVFCHELMTEILMRRAAS